MPKLRLSFPETLPGAAKFSGDTELNGDVEFVRAFKEASWISGPLLKAIKEKAPTGGRPRMPGEWMLAAVAFIVSRQGDIQPFYDRASLALWRECGFEGRPSYSTTHERLTELEDAIPEIEAAIGRMVQEFSRLDPRIGRHIHIDGTEAETHSRFHHDCRDDEHCAWRRDGETAEEVDKRVLGRATTADAQRRRQQEDAGDVDGSAEETPLDVCLVPPAIGGSEHETQARSAGVRRERSLYRIRTSNHAWLTRDGDAGFRTYVRQNGVVVSWHGYYHIRAVDDYTGLTISGLVKSSSCAEHGVYEEILAGIARSMNPPENLVSLTDGEQPLTQALSAPEIRLPEAIAGDKGYGFPYIYETNTRLGIHTVTPWRNVNDGRKESTEIELIGRDGLRFVVDRHGVIHCKHCGGPTRREEFRRSLNETPRIYFRCLLPSEPGSPCEKIQSVPCDLDWRMLTPIERTDERHLAIESRMQFERAHHLGRVRNRNGGKDPILRPKRLGLDWQQLQLSLGTMVDWFRAGLKNGWLTAAHGVFKGYTRRAEDGIKKARKRLEAHVAKRSEAIRRERQDAGLNRCLPGPEPPEPEPPPPKKGE